VEKWWVNYIQEYENWLPRKLKKNLIEQFVRDPDSDSDGE